jgi:hypothetical protein
MTIIDTTRYWLRFVAEENNIHPDEIHHVRRVDDSLRTVMDYVEFRFASSTRESEPIDNSEASGSDADIQIIQPYLRQLTVDAVGENGMEYLEALLASVEHPAVKEIMGKGLKRADASTDLASRMVIVDMGEISDAPTTWNDSDIDLRYTVNFTVRKHTAFEQTREDHIAGVVDMTGKIIVDKNDATKDITIDTDVT